MIDRGDGQEISCKNHNAASGHQNDSETRSAIISTCALKWDGCFIFIFNFVIFHQKKNAYQIIFVLDFDHETGGLCTPVICVITANL